MKLANIWELEICMAECKQVAMLSWFLFLLGVFGDLLFRACFSIVFCLRYKNLFSFNSRDYSIFKLCHQLRNTCFQLCIWQKNCLPIYPYLHIWVVWHGITYSFVHISIKYPFFSPFLESPSCSTYVRIFPSTLSQNYPLVQKSTHF